MSTKTVVGLLLMGIVLEHKIASNGLDLRSTAELALNKPQGNVRV